MRDATSPDAPDGFVPYQWEGGFMSSLGPMFQRVETDGRLAVGLRIAPMHANLHGVAHGGMLATVLDNLLRFNVRKLHAPTVTVHLSIDYFAPAHVGTWLQGEMQVRRRGGRLLFADGELCADGTCVARASAILSLVKTEAAHGPHRASPPDTLTAGHLQP